MLVELSKRIWFSIGIKRRVTFRIGYEIKIKVKIHLQE